MWWRVAGRACIWGVAGALCGVLWMLVLHMCWRGLLGAWLGNDSGGVVTLVRTMSERGERWSFAVTLLAMTGAGVLAAMKATPVAPLGHRMRETVWPAGICALAGGVYGLLVGWLVPALPLLALKWSFGPHVLTSSFGNEDTALLGASCGLWTGNALGALLGALAPQTVERGRAFLAFRVRQILQGGGAP